MRFAKLQLFNEAQVRRSILDKYLRRCRLGSLSRNCLQRRQINDSIVDGIDAIDAIHFRFWGKLKLDGFTSAHDNKATSTTMRQLNSSWIAIIVISSMVTRMNLSVTFQEMIQLHFSFELQMFCLYYCAQHGGHVRFVECFFWSNFSLSSFLTYSNYKWEGTN